jgi:Zn-dependent protease with chaperone function
MDRADFVHLVRLSEHASADDSARYRRGVAAFAALGYLWVLGCLGLAAGLIVWVLSSIREERFSFTRGWVLLFAGGLLWATLRALWVRFDEPDGVELQRDDAPALFEALDRIRARIKGPRVHHVYLDDDFNASIRQVPRFGLFGGAINSLSIGLPLLMMLDRRRLLSVLAHEYGHLRGNHGKLSAWIYRTRLSWLKLDANLQRNEGVMALFSGAFFRWYFPRFAAKTFAWPGRTSTRPTASRAGCWARRWRPPR